MLAAALLAGGLVAHAKVTRTAYFIDEQTFAGYGMLVAWDDSRWRANLTDASGNHDGSYSQSGLRRVFTYDTPQVSERTDWDDDCADLLQIRRQITQAVETRLSGTPRKGSSNWVSLGTDTVLNGCKAGQVTSVGDPDEPGISPWTHVNLGATPPPRPLVAGEGWAGLIEAPRDLVGEPDHAHHIAQDVAKVDATGTAFVMGTTGSVLPATLGGDGWLTTTLPSGTQRAYKRVAMDTRSGAETWLAGDRVQGRLLWVDAWRMVKPQPGANFANLRAAARVWRKADFTYSREYHLYRDLTGWLVDDNVLPEPVHSEWPVTWRYAPEALHIDRTNVSFLRDRLWVPLARYGAQQWVMESELQIDVPTGGVTQLIAPRVAWYTDMGRAVPPTTRRPSATPETARRETPAAAGLRR